MPPPPGLAPAGAARGGAGPGGALALSRQLNQQITQASNLQASEQQCATCLGCPPPPPPLPRHWPPPPACQPGPACQHARPPAGPYPRGSGEFQPHECLQPVHGRQGGWPLGALLGSGVCAPVAAPDWRPSCRQLAPAPHPSPCTPLPCRRRTTALRGTCKTRAATPTSGRPRSSSSWGRCSPS